METKSFVGWTSKRRYRVIIKPTETEKNTVFAYYAEMNDLHQIIKNHINDFGEEDFQIYVKLTKLTEDGSSNVDVQVTVNFEETRNLFYVPEPVQIFKENGVFEIAATEEYEIAIAFAAVLNYDDYSTKILEVVDGLIDKNGISPDVLPTYVLLIVHDRDLDMFEAFPLSITVNYYPNEELLNSEKGQQERVLQFRDFVDDLVQQDGWIEKINWSENDNS